MSDPGLPGIPQPTQDIASLYATVLAMKSVVETLGGLRGGNVSRSARYGEIVGIRDEFGYQLTNFNTTITVSLAGKVDGPASATDNNPALFNGTTGKFIKETTYAAFKTSLGLGNVNNTSDASKPVSAAQAAAIAASGYRLKRIRTITGGLTWIKDADVTAIYVEVQAPGGGGGGADATASGNGVGAGGAGGGASGKWITAPASSYVCTIGAVGGGGAAAGGNGGVGGSTSFGSEIVCNGGGGGGGSAANTAVQYPTTGGTGGSIPTPGDWAHDGENGDYGHMDNTSNRASGSGGGSRWGVGGKHRIGNAATTTNAGSLGKGYGGGGGGAMSGTGPNTAAGGDGGPALIQVWEFVGAP